MVPTFEVKNWEDIVLVKNTETGILQPGKAMDALIAERVMGNILSRGVNGEWGWWDGKRPPSFITVPRYSTDTNEVMAVKKRLNELGYKVRIESYPDGQSFAEVYKDEELFADAESDESEAHAICLVALKIVEARKNTKS